MKTSLKLSNKERAIYLFRLFSHTSIIIDILDVAKQVTDFVLQDPDKIIREWNVPMLSPREWIQSAQRINDSLKKKKANNKTTERFFVELFDMIDSLMMIHSMNQYILNVEPDETFTNAMYLLFPEQMPERFLMHDALAAIDIAEEDLVNAELSEYFPMHPLGNVLSARLKGQGLVRFFAASDDVYKTGVANLIIDLKNKRK